MHDLAQPAAFSLETVIFLVLLSSLLRRQTIQAQIQERETVCECYYENAFRCMRERGVGRERENHFSWEGGGREKTIQHTVPKASDPQDRQREVVSWLVF